MTDARQRWRVHVARRPAARDVPHRDILAAWEAGLSKAGLPLVLTEGRHPQPRVVFAAPVPVGMLADREPVDLWLTDLRRIHEVRSAVEAAMPDGHLLVDLYDVWIGAPSLPASVEAGDYVVAAHPATVSGTPGPLATEEEAQLELERRAISGSRHGQAEDVGPDVDRDRPATLRTLAGDQGRREHRVAGPRGVGCEGGERAGRA